MEKVSEKFLNPYERLRKMKIAAALGFHESVFEEMRNMRAAKSIRLQSNSD